MTAELQDTLDWDSLTRDFQTGLEATQRKVERRDHPRDANVQPVARRNGNIAVRLGEWETARFAEIADVEHAPTAYTVFVRVPQQFPTGGGKGFVTSPPLQRADGRSLNNNPWQQQFARAVQDNIEGEVECYSHNWKNVAMNDPEDLAKVLDVAELFLKRG